MPTVIIGLKVPADLREKFFAAVGREPIPGVTGALIMRSLMVEYINRSQVVRNSIDCGVSSLTTDRM